MKKILTIIIGYLVVFLFIGCMTPPDKKNYAQESCYEFDTCMFYNQKNPDKSVCNRFAATCDAFTVWDKCSDTKKLPERVDFQGCWDKLHTK